MKRREFIGLIGGGAVVWPIGTRGQQANLPRVAAIVAGAASNSEALLYTAAFRAGLGELGWTDGQNIRIDYRWAAGDADNLRSDVADVVAQAPDVILGGGTEVTATLKERTRTIPIVFVHVADPLSGGLVQSFARPGDNITGFAAYESSIGGKWLELLKEIAPHLRHVLVLVDPQSPTWRMHVPAIETVAPSFDVQLTLANVRSAAEIELAVEAFAGKRTWA